MSKDIAVVAKTARTLDAEITQWENRKSFVEGEVKRLNELKGGLESEIAQKQSDYKIFMSQKDEESKKIRQNALDERARLDKDILLFQNVLQQFQKDKAAFVDMKNVIDAQTAKHEEQMNNVRQFIIAVQRATSLLGL